MTRAVIVSSTKGDIAKSWAKGPLVYSIALITSATATGAVTGMIGEILRNNLLPDVGFFWWFALIAIVALGYGLHELSMIRLPYIGRMWQVPAHWSQYGKTVQSALYGLALGAGVFTIIPYAAFYILILLEASAGLAGGLILGFVYGITRVGVVLLSMFLATKQDANTITARIIDFRFAAKGIDGIILLAVGQILLITLLK